MADERMTDREIRDRFESVDKRLDRMVPLDTWTLQIGHDRDKFAELDRDCRERTEDVEKELKELKENKQNVWMRVLQVVGIVATLAAAWWTAYMASKGMK